MDNVLWNGASGSIAGLAVGPATNNDVDVSQYAVVTIGTMAGAFIVTGWNSGGLERPPLLIINGSGQTMTLKHLNGGSAAANQMVGIAAADVVVTSGQRAWLAYDGAAQQWHVMLVA